MRKYKPEDETIHILTDAYDLLADHIDLTGKRIELDLGCGKGGFTLELAKRNPESLIIAADIMIGRLRKLRKRIDRAGLENMQLLRVEAGALLGRLLPDNSISRLHILCPDPWPKDRHRAKRLICSEITGQIHRILKSDGHFHFSSDDTAYLSIVERVVENSGLFLLDNSLLSDIADIKTDFEKRWNSQGKAVHHRLWIKREIPVQPTLH